MKNKKTRRVKRTIQQTILPFKLEITKEKLTAHGGLALMAEFNHGIGLRELTDRYLPAPGKTIVDLNHQFI